MLRKNFEDGRQLYLMLQREKERIENSSDSSTRKLNEVRADYEQLQEFYTMLQQGYEALQRDSHIDRSDLLVI